MSIPNDDTLNNLYKDYNKWLKYLDIQLNEQPIKIQ